MMHLASTTCKLHLALASIALCGCPAHLDLKTEPVKISSSNPAAQKMYNDARARLEAGDYREARVMFRNFRAQYPDDPLGPSAVLWEARADLGVGEAGAAQKLVEPLAARPAGDPVADRARLLLGLALARSSSTADAARSRELLRPFVGPMGSGDDAVELHAALAEASARLGDVGDSLAEYQRFYEGARPP